MEERKHQAKDLAAEPGTLKPLGDVLAGLRGVVRQLRGGQDFMGRMAALGFTVGVEVKVIQNYGRGPLIALVRDTRVALGRGEALKVLVEQVQNESRPDDDSRE